MAKVIQRRTRLIAAWACWAWGFGACSPETVAAPASSTSPGRADQAPAAPPASKTQAEMASSQIAPPPTAAVMPPPSRATSAMAGAGGRDEAKKPDKTAPTMSTAQKPPANAAGASGMSTSTGGSGAQAESCMQLSMCCGTLSRAQQRACMGTVTDARADACSQLLTRRCPELGPAPQEPACATLHDCCGKLTDDRELEQCRRALGDDNKRDCERASMSLCQ